jgi:hypothetical protein
MSATQLAIRFTERQIQTLDILASERQSTRTAVIKELVDQAEKARISTLYASAYERSKGAKLDQFGDLDAFHSDVESERVAGRAPETTW